MDDHFDRVFAAPSSSDATPFIASNRWQGAKPGYVFTTRRGKVGYYLESAGTAAGAGAEEDADDDPPAAKRVRRAEDEEPSIEQLLAKGDAADIEELDLSGLKQLLLAFEKKINKNQNMRVKFPDEPAKFVESEIELDDEIKRMHSIAAVPELYPQLVKLDAVTSMLGLLTHENTDISISMVALLHDLTDPDTLTETEAAFVLVDALLEKQALELLVQNLSRLDEASDEDAEGVHNTMGIFENLSEVRPAVCTQLCEKTSILKFLLKRLKVRKFDPNKLYASEIFAILMQADGENAKRLSQLQGMDGIDMLLQVIAHYKKRTPTGPEEEECVENLFNALCTVLMVAENQTRFRHSEGFELMLRCMRERKHSALPALRVLDFATNSCAANCERLVEAGGLKTVFPALMGHGAMKPRAQPGKKRKKRGLDERRTSEEHIISILASLCFHLTSSSANQTHARFLTKFLDADMEKVDRLAELYFSYHQRVAQQASQEEEEEEEEDDDDDDPDAREFARHTHKLESGLFALRLVCANLAHVAIFSPGCRARLLEKLTQRSHTPAELAAVLADFAHDLGETPTTELEAQTQEKQLKLRTWAKTLESLK